MSRRRLAFVYHRVAPETLGGCERYYETLCRALARESDVTYLTRRHWQGARERVRHGVRVVSVDAARGGADRGRGRLWPKLSFAAGVSWHLLRRGGRYDVVHVCCFPHAGVLGAWAALLPHRRTRLVVDWHEVLPRATWQRRLGSLGQLGFAVQWLALQVGDAAITFSQLHARRLEEEGCRATVRVLPEFHPAVVPPSWPSGVPREPLVLFAGRLAPEKRPELVPAVVAALRKRDPEWRGLIFGDGVQADAVREVIAQRDLTDAVEMSGFAAWEEVSHAMLRASALVAPTTREGFGLVVLEAAAHGLPSVLVAGPDNAAVELIDEGRNGAVVSDAAPESQAAAVLALVAEPRIHDATRAWFDEASRRFSVPGAVAAHRNLHDTLIGRKGAMVETATPLQRARNEVVRTSNAVRRRGLAGSAKFASERVFLHEAHIWYELDLLRDQPRKDMPEGLRLEEASADQIELVERLPSVTTEEARKRAEGGATLWFVLAGDTPAFACWTYPQRTPLLAALSGWLALPDHVNCLEDSVTSPDFRGRGVAPAAWTAVTDRLREQGVSSLITNVAIENVASCRAVDKAGFVHVATMELTRVGPRVRVMLHQAGAGVGPHLEEQLAR